MNLGQSFLAWPFGKFRFSVERNTRVPFFILSSGPWCQFILLVWNMCALIIVSCASTRFCSAWSVKSLIPLGITSFDHIFWIMEGMYPPFSSKGAYWMVPNTLALMANLVRLTLSIQSLWLDHTTMWNIWPTLRFACSVWPSVWGWYEVDIRSLVCNILCNSCHHLDMNFESQSLTIELGSP